MTTPPPTPRELFLFRWAGPAAAWSAVLGPFVTYYAMVLIPLPWGWCALLSSLWCGVCGVTASDTGVRYHRPRITVAGIAAIISAIVQLLLAAFIGVGLAVMSQH